MISPSDLNSTECWFCHVTWLWIFVSFINSKVNNRVNQLTIWKQSGSYFDITILEFKMCSFCSKRQYVKPNEIKTQGWGCRILVGPSLALTSYSCLVRFPCSPCLERKTSVRRTCQLDKSILFSANVKHTETPTTRLKLRISDFETSCPRRNGVRIWNWTIAQCSFCVLKDKLPQTSFSRLLTGTSTTLFTAGHRENTTNETQEAGLQTGVPHASGINMRAMSAASLGMGSG